MHTASHPHHDMVFWGDWIHLVELEMKICLSLGVYNVIICLSKGTFQATIHPGGVLQARLSVLGVLCRQSVCPRGSQVKYVCPRGALQAKSVCPRVEQ